MSGIFNTKSKWIILVIILLSLSLTTCGMSTHDSQAIKDARDAVLSETNMPGISHRQQQFWKKKSANVKIGLALGGGAARGLAHIGVLKAIEESGIDVKYVAGTSMGSLVGAAFANGITADSFQAIALNISKQDVVKLLDPSMFQNGIIKGSNVSEFLQTIYGNSKIEDVELPFAATATDIASGELFVIDSGSVVKAVRSSISIPIVFEAQQYNDVYLVDGGLVDPVPVDVVRSMGSDFIIAVNVNTLRPNDEILIEKKYPHINSDQIQTIKPYSLPIFRKDSVRRVTQPGIFEVTQNTLSITQAQLSFVQLLLEKPDVLVEPNMQEITIWEFYRSEEAFQIGYDAAVKTLTKYFELHHVSQEDDG